MTKKALLSILTLLFLGCNFAVAKRITPDQPLLTKAPEGSTLYTNNVTVPNLDLFQPKNTDITPKFKDEISIKESLFDILNNSLK